MRLCAVILAVFLLPTPALAASWSFSTPYGSTSGSLDPNAVTVSSTGSLSLSSTLLDWSFSLDKPAASLSGSATVNGQAYSGSFDWSDLFVWLFG